LGGKDLVIGPAGVGIGLEDEDHGVLDGKRFSV